MAKQKVEEKAETVDTRFFTSPIGHIRDRILIHESMDIPREGIFMSLNGYPFLVKPNVEIDIPRPVREMLDTRIKTESVQGADGRLHHRNIPRITYTLIKENVGAAVPVPVTDGESKEVFSRKEEL